MLGICDVFAVLSVTVETSLSHQGTLRVLLHKIVNTRFQLRTVLAERPGDLAVTVDLGLCV